MLLKWLLGFRDESVFGGGFHLNREATRVLRKYRFECGEHSGEIGRHRRQFTRFYALADRLTVPCLA